MTIDLRKYLSAHLYLQDCYELRKKMDATFSYSIWATEMQVGNKSYVRMMVFGKRHINDKMIQMFAKTLNLDKDASIYFETLVHYTQSKSSEQRDQNGRKLMGLLRTTGPEKLELASHYEFLSSPLYTRLQVMISFDDLDQSAKSLSWLMGVTEEEVSVALNRLIEWDLAELTEGRYKPKKKSFKISDNFGDLGLESFYNQNLDLAKNAICLPKEVRRFKSLFIPLNAQDFEVYIENLQRFSSEQIARFDTDSYADRRLYQIHFNAIPVTAAVEPGIQELETEADVDV